MPLKKRTGFIFLYGALAATAISLTTLFSLAEIRSDAVRQAAALQESHLRTFWELLAAKGKGLEVADGKLVAGDYVINGDCELPDKIKEIFGGAATIFQGDVRVSTNVRLEDGRRAIGTRLTGPAREAVYLKGIPFRGESLILGIPYFVAYDPIRNAGGEVIGALFVGVKKSDFFASYQKARSDVIFIHLILFGAFSLLTILLLRHRRQAERAISDSEQRLKLVLEGSNDGIWDWDIATGMVQRNGRWEEILDRTTSELGPTFAAWEELVHPDDLPGVRGLLDECLQGRATRIRAEYRMKTGAGAWIWILVRGKVVEWDSDGRPRRMSGTVTDITARRQAEMELRQSHRLMQIVFSSLNDSLILLDGESRTIIDCNVAAENMFGYTWAELVGSNPDILHVDLEMAERFRSQAVRAIAARGYFSTEYPMRRKNGEVFDAEHYCNPTVGEPDDPSIIVCVVRDVTERILAESERVRLEEQLRHAQKMEAVGQLAGGVAHDFNNILTAIMGFGHLLRMKMAAGSPLAHYVESIISSSERAAALTQGLLAFSRKQVIDPQPIDLNRIIGDMRMFMERVIGEDIDLRIDLQCRGLVVMADTGQLEQVLMNLATNARDAMPEGGTILIRTGLLETHPEGRDHPPGPQRYACISVTDTGSGMDDTTREKLFEPFFTTKEVGKGTGLGLSIVYGIVKQHQGHIGVESELGKGTTFTVYLPLVDSQALSRECEPPSFPPCGRETILVAEDDADVRELDRSLLEVQGYTVIEAVDGQDAVDKYAAHMDRISLVILDVVMPRKNGKDAFVEIRRLRNDVRVIFMSGYTADIISKKGILDEGIDFVEKPVLPMKFLSKVREVLDRDGG